MHVPAFSAFVVAVLVACSADPAFALNRRIIDDNDTVMLRGNTDPRAFAEPAAGAADPELPMEHMVLSLSLSPDKEAQLNDLLASQQDPASPHYHRWLTPDEFGQKFGRSQEQVAAVTNWLSSHGFRVEEVSKGGTSITFSGTSEQVRGAFHTTIESFNVKGRVRHANTSDPSIPRGLADLVHGVVSLHNFPRVAMNTGLRPLAAGGPNADYTTGGSHYLSPADFATIYNVNPLYSAGIDGTGQTIAIVGRTHPSSTNWSSFRSAMGLPANPPQVIVNGPDPGDQGSGENTEADLDVEWAGAVAKKATIKLVISKSTNTTDGVDLSALYVVNNNVAPVMSVSFGQCEAYMGSAENAFYNNLWKQAAAQGISVFVASGDSGVAGCEGSGSSRGSVAAVSGLASTPYNVAVGGTQFTEGSGSYWSGTNGTGYSSALGYIPESAWNESGSVSGGWGLSSTGGGASSIYSKPAWQSAPGVPADGKRDVPDVSLTASGHDGYLIYSGGRLTACGGTSASSPAFAGLMALVVQATGQPQGNPNLRFYQLAKAQMSSGGAAVFHDIIAGSNSVPGVSGYPATVGFDLATGLGSVDATAMVKSWGQTAPSDPLVTSSFTVPAVTNSTLVPITAWTTSGSGTVAGYQVTTSSTPPSATATGWSTSKPTTYNAGTAGRKTLYAWLKNSFGVVSSPASAAVNIDLTAPVITSFTSTATVNTANIAVSITASDDNSGIAGYAVTDSSTAPAATSSVWKSSAPASYTLSSLASGNKTLYAWVKDAANNVSKAATSVTVIDATLPVVTSFTISPTANALSIPISAFAASDNQKVTGYLVTDSSSAPAPGDSRWSATAPTRYQVGTAGIKTLYAWARDAAGNVSQPKMATSQVDTSAPVVTAFTVPEVSKTVAVPITSYKATDDVSVTAYLVTESASAPASTDSRWSTKIPSGYTFGSAGTKTLYAWVKDAAGNVSTSRSAAVSVDTSAPAVTAFTTPALGNSLAVPVTAFTASDNIKVTGYLVTEGGNQPSATDAAWSSVPQTSYTFASAGNKTLRAWAKDSAGNVSSARTCNTTVDMTLPSVNSFTLPAISNSRKVAIKSLGATDSVGLAGYVVTESADKPAAADSRWSGSAPTSYSFDSDGSKTLYSWAKDKAGNVSQAKTAVTVVDTTPPSVSSFAVPERSKTVKVPVTSFAATDAVNVAAYLVTESATAPAAGDARWSATPPATYAVGSQGSKTVYGWVKDSAGNVSAAASAKVLVDTTSPAVTSFAIPSVANALTIPVTAFAAKDETGVAAYMLSETAAAPSSSDSRWSTSAPTSYTFASSGNKTVYSWAMDTCGNISSFKNAATTIDTTAPVISAFATPLSSTTLTLPVSTLTANDNVKVVGYLLSEAATAPAANDSRWSGTAPKSYTFGADGTKNLYLWVKDAAGNVSASRSVTATVKVAVK